MRLTEDMTDTIADTERIIPNALVTSLCPSPHAARASIGYGMIDVVVVLDIVMVYGVFAANYGILGDSNL